MEEDSLRAAFVAVYRLCVLHADVQTRVQPDWTLPKMDTAEKESEQT